MGDDTAKAEEAQARLRNAAPALLAALEALVDEHSAGGTPTEAHWRTARGALAQAKG